ncbi:hypothetical protein BG006_009268 [Podila minutissima]|uniref:Uncharacterized protein n=1 Tax=Podila minutissima TaxID=64525 RepID=A0A9P5SEM7_9FUNG|nr:hypothetical protein BG006_009268 [Podila minutissima]
MPQSPLDLPEIRMLIAEHLSRAALLACCPPFWKFCRSVETLSAFNSVAQDCPLIHTHMLRLKHLHIVRSTVMYRDGWKSAKTWLCSSNLETLSFNISHTSGTYDDEFHEMVLNIKAATAAAATGKNHYALQHKAHADELEEDMERYRGLVPGKKLHSSETNENNIMDEDLGFLIDNMETLRKLCLPKLPFGTATMGALGRHHRTIVELDLQCEFTNGTRALV